MYGVSLGKDTVCRAITDKFVGVTCVLKFMDFGEEEYGGVTNVQTIKLKTINVEKVK